MPIVVAVNKVDLPQANAAKVKQDLLTHGVVLEEFGGTVLSAEISAKKGTNIDALLDAILLQAELLDRTGKVLKVPVTATLSPAEGDLSWAVADVALAPLAAADYAVRVKVVLAGATHETLLAFRIVP